MTTSNTSSEVMVQRVDDKRWMLVRALRYEGREDVFTVPAGFITDFASVPRVLIWLIPSYGRYTPAAILHDWFCNVGIQNGIITSPDADGMFRRAMREEGVLLVRRWLMWTGVRLGALFNPVRRPGWRRDAGKVAVLTVAFVPMVATGVVFVMLSLGLYGCVERVAGLWSRR